MTGMSAMTIAPKTIAPKTIAPMTAAHTTTELVHLSASEAGQLLRARKLSPVELTDAFLARIDRVDGKIKSYLLVDAAGARAKAKSAEAEIMAGRWRGPLHGIPYGVKDTFYTKGLRTCANSRVFLDVVPDYDAAIIEKLDAAGAILLGKLNTWEYGTGLGLVYHDAAFAHSSNPWKDDYFTGGSSTGSGAAVAAGTAMFALGADTGGSIRAPAAGCGIQGLKPTYGRISRHGILPNCWSLDVAGPMTWTIEDCAHVLQTIAGFDPRDPGCADVPVPSYLDRLADGVAGLTIGIVRGIGHSVDIDPANAAGIEDVAAVLVDAGARLVELSLPGPPLIYRQVTTLISGSERASAHERDFIEHGDKMGRELRDAVMAGLAARSVDYLAAQRRRRELAAAIDAVVAGVDAVLLPGMLHTAPPASDPERVKAFMSDAMTTAFNISGHPALAMRTGFDHDGLPTNAQIVGRSFDEATVLRVAHTYERARKWHERRPAL
jgi:aspartyl-tRNA(Asn)/glutamyl-tRNA(Gln) amidotransferase subunit A